MKLALDDLWKNLAIVALCYAYICLIVLASSRVGQTFGWSERASRKFLHMTIGNLPFVFPLFTANIYPVMVSFPFIVITFLACPYSPNKRLRDRLAELKIITEKGHSLGLVFYSISYTVLAAVFFNLPYVVVAGILPMAYGDAVGAIVGERYGKRKYKIVAEKSVEGSIGVFAASFLSVLCGLVFYSLLYPFSTAEIAGYSLLTAFGCNCC